MPLASDSPQYVHYFTVTNGADLINAVNTFLQQCGWISTAVTDGFKLLGENKQGLQINLFVRDLGHKFGVFFPPEITFNFQTVDTTITGMDQEVMVDASWTYQIIASKCQFFICALGVLYDVSGSSLCGGIPFIAGAVGTCSGEAIINGLPTQAFWSMGDHNDGGSPRRYLIQGESPFGSEPMRSCEALWGTDYCAENNHIGALRIPALTVSTTIFSAFNRPVPILYHDDTYLTYEPFLVWGTDETVLPVVRAQIPDALITSKQFDMDTSRIIEGISMINFTHQYLYGALHLIASPLGGGNAGNYCAVN